MQQENQSPAIKLEAQQIGLFETPIAYCRVKEPEPLLKELEGVIRKRMAEHDGVSRSNVGGWHSDTDMLQWGGQAAQDLARSAIAVAKRMSHFQDGSADDLDWSVRMWANVTPKGGLNSAHAHPGNLWAAVLYVDMGDDGNGEDVGGSFFLEDPRFPMAAMRETALRLRGPDGTPQSYEVDLRLERGNLVMFPAWLRHGVRPYLGSRERISIAMNVDARRRT